MTVRALQCLTGVTSQPPCSRVFARSVPIVVDDHSSTRTSCVLSVIIAALNCASFVTDAMKFGGIIRCRTAAQEILPEPLGPTTTNFLTL